MYDRENLPEKFLGSVDVDAISDDDLEREIEKWNDEKSVCVVSSQSGIYIPNILANTIIDAYDYKNGVFVNEHGYALSGIEYDDLEYLADEDNMANHDYDDTWDMILNNIKIKKDGVKYFLEHNEDLFLYHEDFIFDND